MPPQLQATSLSFPDDPALDSAIERAGREEELRAMRALRILLESKLIDQLEFERRLAVFQDKANS